MINKEKVLKEIEEKEKWIIENAEKLKKGFRKTKTFQKIINGTIDVMKEKGWGQAELFRPLLEELYLNGCVQGVNGQRVMGLKEKLNIITEVGKVIDEWQKKHYLSWSNPKSCTAKDYSNNWEELKKELGI